MNKFKLLVIMVLTGGLLIIGCAKDGSDQQTVRFVLPNAHPVDFSKPVKCTAIASTSMIEQKQEKKDFTHAKLTVKMGKGKDKLTLQLDGETLSVQAVESYPPDQYRVIAHRGGCLIATYYGGLMPVAKTVTVEEESGFAVWSEAEPVFFPVSSYPCASSVYFHCAN